MLNPDIRRRFCRRCGLVKHYPKHREWLAKTYPPKRRRKANV